MVDDFILETWTISTHALREEGDQTVSVLFLHRLISTHALREEGDRALPGLGQSAPISTHALREEGDFPVWLEAKVLSKFLPTPSARRATYAPRISRRRQ